jgi:hypothetical protein
MKSIDIEQKIYHFTKLDTALLRILPTMKLRLSPFLDSNDPKEYKSFGFWSILEDFPDFERNKIKDQFQVFLRNQCKQLCFSLCYFYNDTFIDGYNHPAMWAHYGENQKGICIVLDKEQFIKSNPGLLHCKVDYLPSFKFSKLKKDKAQHDHDHFKRYLIKNQKKLFFTKHLHWACEHEYKFVGIGDTEFCSITDSLTGIFVGNNFPKELLSCLFGLVPKYVDVKKIIFDNGSLGVIPLNR